MLAFNCSSSFPIHVSKIVSLRPDPKMLWIYARRIVATMENRFTFWYPTVVKFVRISVSVLMESGSPVSSWEPHSTPDPTSLRGFLLDFKPKFPFPFRDTFESDPLLHMRPITEVMHSVYDSASSSFRSLRSTVIAFFRDPFSPLAFSKTRMVTKYVSRTRFFDSIFRCIDREGFTT